MEEITYIFDTQLLIEGQDLDPLKINEEITQTFEGDCLLVVGGDDLVKIHFHTNAPWEILAYASKLGDIHDIVVENMLRQSKGLQG